jgi:hypothetical protein
MKLRNLESNQFAKLHPTSTSTSYLDSLEHGSEIVIELLKEEESGDLYALSKLLDSLSNHKLKLNRWRSRHQKLTARNFIFVKHS